MPTDLFLHQTAGLRALGGQRVWSLMVSLFGDLAQSEGDTIDGPVLSSMMAALQVKPEAVRVALHRLRNDGWITSAKSGRISVHALSAKGRAESADASPRIYAQPGAMDEPWQLVLLPEPPNEIDAAFTAIGPRLFVGPANRIAPKDALRFNGGHVPDWLRAQVLPTHLAPEYAALHLALTDLQTLLPKASDLSALEIAALRCLIVHYWRRLVLKHPALPASLVSQDWVGHQCHILVADLLARYSRPDLAALVQRHAA